MKESGRPEWDALLDRRGRAAGLPDEETSQRELTKARE